MIYSMKSKTLKSFLLFLLVALFLSSCGKDEKKGYNVTPTDNIKTDSNGNTIDTTQNGASANKVDEEELDKDKDVIEVRERVFMAQISDIYSNFQDYENKTIRVEGMFSEFQSDVDGRKEPVVYRKGPGCCGNDGWGGFILKYDGKLPKEDDWIKVEGKPLLEETDQGYFNLYLKVDKLEVSDKRGAEFVKQ